MALVNINGVLVNPAVAKMYGIPYHKLTRQQKKVLHADSVRRAKENAAREKAVLKNNLKAFTDEKKMESVLAQIYQGCQKQILADVAKTMAEVQKAGGTWSYANQSALTRSKGLFYQIEEELKKLGVAQTNTMYSGLGNIYTDQFLRTTFELGQTLPMPATVNFTKLNPALVRRTLDYPWSGELFSDRIWADKAKLGRSLRVNLTASMVLGEDMRRISERINKNVQESENAAMRLARTETKRVVYVAHDDVYEEFGVDELEYRCANGIDNRTCKVCKQFNGTVYKRGQEIPLPVHPNCRCVYIPVVADTFKPGELNELTHDTRGAENYEKWLEKERKEAEAQKVPIQAEVKPPTQGKAAAKGKESLQRTDNLTLTDYPEPFYSKKAEAKNTQALMDYVNGCEGANADTVSLYKSLDKMYNFDEGDAVEFVISHANSHAVSTWTNGVDDIRKVQLTIPKLAGEDLTGQVATTLHEEMHLMDELLSEGNRVLKGGRHKSTAWVSEANPELAKVFDTVDDTIGDEAAALFDAFGKECDRIHDECRALYNAEISKLTDECYPNGMFGAGADYKRYKREANKIRKKYSDREDYLARNALGGGVNCLQDIYDALSGGTHRDSRKVRYGHGKKYYSNRKKRCSEALAQYGVLSIIRPDLIRLLIADKPELVAALEGTVSQMLALL